MQAPSLRPRASFHIIEFVLFIEAIAKLKQCCAWIFKFAYEAPELFCSKQCWSNSCNVQIQEQLLDHQMSFFRECYCIKLFVVSNVHWHQMLNETLWG